ncbi:hypothetical protein OOK31_21045 [Streptomyces sp. NBC_00249]|uniref:hypothetical protein n=1 Tax=Streptomyces sp. NBC_00249 TaxID=2975690 RepID=UPI00224E9276|nr:hypothetical protein [Streptomyces sp. NBC_00249]MCX5196354.1 hypothetical protein [Streptomyces sp. NBC_00249]
MTDRAPAPALVRLPYASSVRLFRTPLPYASSVRPDLHRALHLHLHLHLHLFQAPHPYSPAHTQTHRDQHATTR